MLKLLYLPISRFCTMEIFIFALHNENKIYILHGAQYWKLDLWKLSDFAWCKVILIFAVYNEEKLGILPCAQQWNLDICQFPVLAWCKMWKFWYESFLHSLKRASETFEYEEKSFQTMR